MGPAEALRDERMRWFARMAYPHRVEIACAFGVALGVAIVFFGGADFVRVLCEVGLPHGLDEQ